MDFEWNEAKREKTIAKRDLDFRYAVTVFDVRRSQTIGVARTDREGRERYSAVGAAAHGEILFVVYTWRIHEGEGEKVCRIISARTAHKVERRRYEALR